MTDKTPEEVLRGMRMRSDFQGEIDFNWIHRRDGDTDIYFVANSTRQAKMTHCIFRVTGKRPELWNPETGRIEKCAGIRRNRRRHADSHQFRAERLGVRRFPRQGRESPTRLSLSRAMASR